MNTCEGCENWHNPWDDEHGETWLVGSDEAPRWGTCRLIGLHDDHEGYASVTLPAFTRDGSDYKADLHTRADFGCTLWAPHKVVVADNQLRAIIDEAFQAHTGNPNGPSFGDVLREVVRSRQASGELPSGEVHIAADVPSSGNPSGVIVSIFDVTPPTA